MFGCDIEYIEKKIEYWKSMKTAYGKLERRREIEECEKRRLQEETYRAALSQEAVERVKKDVRFLNTNKTYMAKSENAKTKSVTSKNARSCYWPGCKSKKLFGDSDYCWDHFQDDRYRSK